MTIDSRAREAVVDFITERRWSEEDYLLLADGTNAIVELSEGRLVVEAMPSPQHQSVVLNLATMLRASPSGKVFVAPMPVRLWPSKFREPDLCWYALGNLDRVGERYGGPPDLVIEVLSPSTRGIDLGEKLDEYARAGVPEYWTVDLDATTIALHSLEGGRYGPASTSSPGDTVKSLVITDLSLAVGAAFD